MPFVVYKEKIQFPLFQLFLLFQVLTVKLNGQSTPLLAVLQPLSVSLGLIVFFPMGLSLNLENHLVCKSNHNVTKETTPAHTSQLEADDLDYITQRFAKKLWHPKYIPQSFEMHRSGMYGF